MVFVDIPLNATAPILFLAPEESNPDWGHRVCRQHPLPISQEVAHGFIEQLKAIGRTEAGSNQEPSSDKDHSKGKSFASRIEGEPSDDQDQNGADVPLEDPQEDSKTSQRNRYGSVPHKLLRY